MTNRMGAAPGERPRFWSEAACKDILQRLQRVTSGGGVTTISVWSTWTGYVRWARNLVSTAGEMRDNVVRIDRNIKGARSGFVVVSDVSDAGLEAAARHAEREAIRSAELPDDENARAEHLPLPLEPVTGRAIFSDATYQLDDEQRTTAAQRLAQIAADKGMLSAGYVQVAARGVALLDTLGHVRYVPYTQAQYSVTVRDPKGTGSGWAGDSSWDWAAIDPDRLTRVALEKCVASQHPVRLEPQRYTAILEPQAVADLVGQLMYADSVGDDTMIGRETNEWDTISSSAGYGPFNKSALVQAQRGVPGKPGVARLGERVIDPRLSIGTDPTDPELGYPPFGWHVGGNVAGVRTYHPAMWIKDGVLLNLAYLRNWGAQFLKVGAGLPNPGGFRMSVTGTTNTVDEMVRDTKRGLLVTRFDQVQYLDLRSTLCRGYTRDGLWLVEDGKVSKPVKNFQFTQPILGALNSVEQVGTPVRAFHPMATDISGFPQPVIVPALKIQDFSFTSLSDAV